MAAMTLPLMISIHAPREGGDYLYGHVAGYIIISIHAPREGGDMYWENNGTCDNEFQSTPPARGATLPIAADL